MVFSQPRSGIVWHHRYMGKSKHSFKVNDFNQINVTGLSPYSHKTDTWFGRAIGTYARVPCTFRVAPWSPRCVCRSPAAPIVNTLWLLYPIMATVNQGPRDITGKQPMDILWKHRWMANFIYGNAIGTRTMHTEVMKVNTNLRFSLHEPIITACLQGDTVNAIHEML